MVSSTNNLLSHNLILHFTHLLSGYVKNLVAKSRKRYGWKIMWLWKNSWKYRRMDRHCSFLYPPPFGRRDEYYLNDYMGILTLSKWPVRHNHFILSLCTKNFKVFNKVFLHCKNIFPCLYQINNFKRLMFWKTDPAG